MADGWMAYVCRADRFVESAWSSPDRSGPLVGQPANRSDARLDVGLEWMELGTEHSLVLENKTNLSLVNTKTTTERNGTDQRRRPCRRRVPWSWPTRTNPRNSGHPFLNFRRFLIFFQINHPPLVARGYVNRFGMDLFVVDGRGRCNLLCVFTLIFIVTYWQSTSTPSWRKQIIKYIYNYFFYYIKYFSIKFRKSK